MYSESGKDYEKIPQWVNNLLAFGYEWKGSSITGKRRIAVISMPCESLGAPLIAIGAIRKDLEDKNANNLQGHFEYLIRTRNNLTAEEKNNCILLDEAGKKWKFSDDYSPETISLIQANYSNFVLRKGRQIANPVGPVSRTVYPSLAKSIRLNTDSKVEECTVGRQLSEEDYNLLTQFAGTIVKENLSRSFSGVLLIGKAFGKDSKYSANLYDTYFYGREHIVSLGTLLTYHHNRDRPISRLSFCNFGDVERQSQEHYLVIADGSRAFCSALQYFRHSDIIGVCSRDEPMLSLASLEDQLTSMTRHYGENTDSQLLQFATKSISIRICEKR